MARQAHGKTVLNEAFFLDLATSAPVTALVAEATEVVADAARAAAPVGDTGKYRDGISTAMKFQKRAVGLVIAADPKSLIIEAKKGVLVRALKSVSRSR